MRSFHFYEFHVPKGPNLRLMAISAVWMFAICLALFGVFTFMGGTAFSASMGGTAGLAFLLIGFVLSLIFAYLERDSK